jgi:hypothetical protein
VTAFCKECRHIYTRPLEELHEAALARLKEAGVTDAPYWGCGHPRSQELTPDRFGFVSCERMRLNGAPCTPEGVLFEARTGG